jgi:hypothetical protein
MARNSIFRLASISRLTSYYRTTPTGDLDLADGSDGQWSTPPPFPLGNGGLAETADDWLHLLACCWLEAPPIVAADCCPPIRCSS